MHDTMREFREHIALVNRVSEPLGIVWLGLGVHPLAPVEELPRMPRERHAIMREYLGRRDTLGLHMMHATAGVQANFDFASEADAARKLRLALAASPISSALFANSCISQGKPNGFESFRAWIWRSHRQRSLEPAAVRVRGGLRRRHGVSRVHGVGARRADVPDRARRPQPARARPDVPSTS